MAERADITVDWGIFSRSSPRVIEVGSPSTTLILQDFVDTLRSNTLPAGEPDLDNLDDDAILSQEFDPAGKTPVQPGLQTGITATMFNAKLRFAARAGPAYTLCSITQGNLVSYLRDTGSQTGGDSNTVLIDSAADFINFGIEEKDLDRFVVRNVTDGSSAEVVTVDSGTQITTDGLTGGSDNLFQAGDVVIVEGYATSPILPSAFTTVSYAASEAPSITALSIMESQIADIHGQVRRAIFINTEALTNGNGYQQTPYNNWTDGVDDAEASGLQTLYLEADATVDRQLKNFEILGIDLPQIDLNGQNMDNTVLRLCDITGTQGATGQLIAFDCRLTNVTDFNGAASLVGAIGTIALRNGGASILNQLVPFTAAQVTIDFTLGGAAATLEANNVSGDYVITNMDNVGDTLHLAMDHGQVTIAASCTAGTIVISGNSRIIDNSAGTTVNVIANIEPIQLQEIYTLLGLEEGNYIDITPTGVDSEDGSIDINFTGDGVSLTRMDRQP